MTAALPASQAMPSINRLVVAMEQSRLKMRPMDLFKALDADHSGSIDRKELEKGLVRVGMAEGMEKSEFKELLHVLDENRNGKIDMHEWLKAIKAHSVHTSGADQTSARNLSNTRALSSRIENADKITAVTLADALNSRPMLTALDLFNQDLQGAIASISSCEFIS